MRVIWQCELDPYCNVVLAHHWPDVPRYEDIREVDWENVERPDLICGGFPCQPVSLAGKRLAQEDPRWLWPEFARVVGCLLPRYVLVENVPGLASRGLSDVVGSLAALGYDAEWDVVSAASVGAPHLRERLFVVAYPNTDSERQSWGEESHGEKDEPGKQAPLGDDACGLRDALPDTFGESIRVEPGRGSGESLEGAPESGDDGEEGTLADTNSEAWEWPRPTGQAIYRPEEIERLRRRRSGENGPWAAEPDVGRVAHGVPNRLPQLRALGNAVVPQVAEFVGRLIVSAEACHV